MSNTKRVLSALVSGEKMTAKQIGARFGVGNPYELVRQLRFKGYAIHSNPSTNSKGETKNFYRLGTPTRKVVAAGYLALSA